MKVYTSVALILFALSNAYPTPKCKITPSHIDDMEVDGAKMYNITA